MDILTAAALEDHRHLFQRWLQVLHCGLFTNAPQNPMTNTMIWLQVLRQVVASIYTQRPTLEQQEQFLDVARSVAEQVPGMTSSMKHLNPKSYLACEEIISTQPIISAASSAAGTAKVGDIAHALTASPSPLFALLCVLFMHRVARSLHYD